MKYIIFVFAKPSKEYLYHIVAVVMQVNNLLQDKYQTEFGKLRNPVTRIVLEIHFEIALSIPIYLYKKHVNILPISINKWNIVV